MCIVFGSSLSHDRRTNERGGCRYAATIVAPKHGSSHFVDMLCFGQASRRLFQTHTRDINQTFFTTICAWAYYDRIACATTTVYLGLKTTPPSPTCRLHGLRASAKPPSLSSPTKLVSLSTRPALHCQRQQLT